MNLFIHPTEGRLRAFWRLLIQLIVYFIATGVFNLAALYLLAVGLALAGRMPFSALVSSEALAQALNQQFAVLPILAVIRLVMFLLMMLGLFWMLAHWLDRRPLRDYGLRLSPGWWRDFGFGLALGALLMTAIFLIERAAGWVEVTGQFQVSGSNMKMAAGWGLAVMLTQYILVGAQEELIFRGYQLRNVAEGLNGGQIGPRRAVLLSFGLTSLVFGLAHLTNPNASLVSTINIALLGLMLGLGYVMTGELAIPIGLHITWNFFQGNVFGFPVSGNPSAVSMLVTRQGGPDLWTGGAFGPEAGLLTIFVALVGLALTWGWIRWTSGRARVHEGLAIYRANRMEAGAEIEKASPSMRAK